MASVLTHKKVPEWGGFNWGSPRQRHRFCYKVDGGASFFSDLGNQNISGFRHTKQIEIKNPQNKQIQNNKKNKNPTDLTYTDCVHEIRRIFFFRFCSGNNDPTDLCHTICAIKIRSFLVFIPISEGFFFSRSVLHSRTVCAPMIRGISLFRSIFLFFFLLIYFKWDPTEKNFRSFGVQICTTPIQRFFNTLYRSDGFLALQIRRFFGISDPTVFGHTPDPKDFSPPNSPWIFDYQNQAGCGTRKIWTKFK